MFARTWDTHQYNKVKKLFRDATVGGEATQALKHVSCDASSRLKQPPARRQVAIAHAEMFNAVVPMDVNFWKLKERSSREKKTLTVPNIVEAAIGNAHGIQSSKLDIEHAVGEFRERMASLSWCRQSLRDGERKFAMTVVNKTQKTEPVTRRAVRVTVFTPLTVKSLSQR